MGHIPFVILAYFLNAVSILIDKFLLTKKVANPLVYIFYFSSFSLLALVLFPWTHPPSLIVLILASISTILWTTGAYFMFKALQQGEVSGVIPIIGTLISLFLFGDALLNRQINENQIWAISLLLLGLVFLTFHTWRRSSQWGQLCLEFFSALFFAASYVVLRQAYLQETFLTVLVYSRVVLIPVGFVVLVIPILRRTVLSNEGKPAFNLLSKSGLLFLAGQAAAGTQELLLTFSISLATPALVNSLQGIQYVFLFILSLVLSKKLPLIYKENLSKLIILGKILGFLLVGVGLFVLAVSQIVPKKAEFGVSFSHKFASQLGFDPKEVYLKMLDDLKVKTVRLPVYWDDVEKEPGDYDFSLTDFYIKEAEKRGVRVVLVIGYRVPRWPECFAPSWANGLSAEQRSREILSLVEAEVNYFKQFNAIEVWQVENESLLSQYGICYQVAPSNLDLLIREVRLVKALDSRPVLITGSGELSLWVDEMKLGDIFGTTLYKTVWNQVFGFFQYHYPPVVYSVKESILRFLTNTSGKPSWISELQAEPWAPDHKHLTQLSVDMQANYLTGKQLMENVEFSKKVGFQRIYLWGVEWWYFMKIKGYPEYWDFAKDIFQ